MKPSPLLPANSWLDELARQIERLRVSIDPDAVHRLRVSAGRLSVWLEVGGRRALRDDLRGLRRSAGAVRDLDVIASNAAQVADAAWVETLRQERAEEAARLRAAIGSSRIDALVEALSLVPEPDPVCVRSAMQRMKRRVLRAGDRLEEPEGSERALHRLRRRLRRLRYALDWTGSEVKDLRALQENLGDLNNLSIELEKLDTRKGDPALDGRRKFVRNEMDEHRKRALGAWRDLRPRIGEL
ncbi:MAG: CHAD domain-containing protein [Planctomycetota bacterium]|nr:CHAD domain-containing protein [Planctomycetota bacterium]